MIINGLTTAIIYLLVGISVLLIGMKMMSTGLKKCIGRGIRRFFKKTENNPIVSLGIGTVVTAGIQSSDATNAMVIGFINAGAMSMFQGLCIMLGAYIGTTATGILASFSSLPISLYFLGFAFIGIVLTFINNDFLKNIGDILAGLGLLFFGLAIMKAGFKQPDIVNGIQQLFGYINYGPLLYFFGILLTALVQSSSAVTSIVIAMVGAASISLGSGLYIVLGAMVGTVVTTLLASIGGPVNGKRAAWIAFSLRLITTLLMLIFLSIFNAQISSAMHVFAINGSDELPVALFTVFFNILFMPLCIPFLKPLIKLFEKIVKERELENAKAKALKEEAELFSEFNKLNGELFNKVSMCMPFDSFLYAEDTDREKILIDIINNIDSSISLLDYDDLDFNTESKNIINTRLLVNQDLGVNNPIHINNINTKDNFNIPNNSKIYLILFIL